MSLPVSQFLLYQSESLVVCDVDEDLVKKLREFRFRKETNNAAIVSKYCQQIFFFFACILTTRSNSDSDVRSPRCK